MRTFSAKDPFFVQWHITDRCNLSCSHCYRDSTKSDLDPAQLAAIFDQIEELRAVIPQHRLRMQLTGGEPLLSEQLWPLLDRCASAAIPARILSNGVLIDRQIAAKLRSHKCSIVQVSLDGSPATHDRIRGPGSFERAAAGIRHLNEAGIEVTIAMTVTRANLADVPSVLDFARQHARRVGFHRLVPCGRGRALQTDMLSPTELERLFELINKFRKINPKVEIPLRDPLWHAFHRQRCASSCVSGCSAGYGGICIDSDGTVYPCRRLPIMLGNALKDSLVDLWCSETMDSLRDRDALQGKCSACTLRWSCGGCRGIAHAALGDYLAEDPQCFYKEGALERAAARILDFAENRGGCD